MFEDASWLIAALCEAPIASELALLVNGELERQRCERDDRERKCEDAEARVPLLVNPDEHRDRAVCEEHKAVDAARNGHGLLSDAGCAQDECGNESCPGHHLRGGKNTKQSAGSHSDANRHDA